MRLSHREETFILYKSKEYDKRTKQMNQLELWSDLELVRYNDPKALPMVRKIIYERYASKVYTLAKYLTKNVEQAQDLTHDVFVKIFLKLHTFKGDAPFEHWVKKITYNTCITALKKANRLKTTDALEIDSTLLSNESKSTANSQKLFRYIEQLKNEDQVMLYLKYWENATVEDIASLFELGQSAVKMRLKRAREKLAELLNATNDGRSF